MLQYLRVRPQVPGPIFVTKRGVPLGSHWVSTSLNKALSGIGLDAARYSSHSFRSGAVTEAAKGGATDTQIRLMGRWRSDAYRRYIRPDVMQFWK